MIDRNIMFTVYRVFVEYNHQFDNMALLKRNTERLKMIDLLTKELSNLSAFVIFSIVMMLVISVIL